MKNNTTYFEEDEIDLKIILDTLIKRKKIILFITFFITLISIIYTLLKPNIYQVDSVIEIGHYEENRLIENPNILIEKLKIKYDINGKEIKKEYPIIKNIEKISNTENLINISILGISKTKMLSFIDNINKKIIDNNLKMINEYKNNIKYSINEYQNELNKLNKILNDKKSEFIEDKKKAQNLIKHNPSLGTIYFIEILKIKDEIQVLNNKKFELTTLINNKKMKLLPLNIKPTKVVKVIVYKNKVKPRRSIIVIQVFFISLILSFLLVLFMEIIRGNRKK